MPSVNPLVFNHITHAHNRNSQNAQNAIENNNPTGLLSANVRNANLQLLSGNRPAQRQISNNASALSQLSNGLMRSPHGLSVPAPVTGQQQGPFIGAGVEAYQQNLTQFPNN